MARIIIKKRVGGEVIFCYDKCWHIKWLNADGSNDTSKYGFNSREAAERHMNMMLGNPVDD